MGVNVCVGWDKSSRSDYIGRPHPNTSGGLGLMPVYRARKLDAAWTLFRGNYLVEPNLDRRIVGENYRTLRDAKEAAVRDWGQCLEEADPAARKGLAEYLAHHPDMVLQS